MNIVASLTQTASSPTSPLLDISTTNGVINASLTLNSVGTPTRGGTFAVRASGMNAGGRFDFPYAPTNSTLLFNATMAHGVGYARPLRVTLPAAFEGGFVLHTAGGGQADIEERKGLEDPSGAGRKRALTYISWPWWKAGKTWWLMDHLGEDVRGEGMVNLESAGNVTLVV
jgi:hypothetical protein